MNDLWLIGMVGGGAGMAVGGPLLFSGSPADSQWSVRQLTGLWLVHGAAAMLLIGLRHGGLLSPEMDTAVEHLTYALNLVAWPVLVTLSRRIAGVGPGVLSSPWRHMVPAGVYTACVVLLGGREIPFLWLLPVSLSCVTVVATTWLSARRMRSLDAERSRLLTAVFAFVVLFGAAQTTRTLFSSVAAVREIVPVVMTVAFFAAGYVVVRSAVAQPAAMARGEAAYRHSKLTPEHAQRLLAELDAGMRTEQWYRAADLSPRALAERLAVPAHLLSQSVNQLLGRSVTQYVSDWRIDEVRQLLRDAANDCFTVDALASRAGFTSRSAFYSQFRKAEGMTPTEYRKRVRAQR